MLFRAFVFFACFSFANLFAEKPAADPTGIPSTQYADSLASFQRVKDRALIYLLGEQGEGEYRRKALQQLDQWVEQKVSVRFEPLLWEEDAALVMNQRLAAFAGELQRLAVAFRSEGSRFEGNEHVRRQIVAGVENVLKYYNQGTPRPGNWYQWLISLPHHLGAIGLLMEADLPPAVLFRLKESLRYDLSTRLILTGTNASWEARNHIYLALLDEDLDRLRCAADYVFRSVRFGPHQGIREDFAYLFHGRIPYAGGYGSGFAQTVSEFIYVFDGTPWAISPLHRDIVRNMLMEHTRWFLADGYLDLHVRGRSFKEGKGNWNPVLEALLVLAQTQDPRSQEVAQTAAAMIKAQPQLNLDLTIAGFADKLKGAHGNLPLGYRYWPSAEMGVYRAPSFHIGFRQFSSRVQDYEYLARSDGGSGGEGWNLPYGFTNILRKDGANSWYHEDGDGKGMLSDIDPEHLPGTTARMGANPLNPPFKQDSKKQTMSTTGFSLNFGTSAFAGGAGWHGGGVAGFVLEPVYGEFSAKKSLHFFARGYWALGSGISSNPASPETNKNPIHTTVLQWATRTDAPVIALADRNISLKPGRTEILRNVNWLWIEGENVGVVFSEAENIEVRLKGKVITAWLNHGVLPSAARYAYAVLPDATHDDVKVFASTLPVRPVRHDDKVHAVADESGDHAGIVFFQADSCMGIGTGTPVIVFRQSGSGGTVYTVQEPLHENKKLNLTIPEIPGKIINPDGSTAVRNTGKGLIEIEISSVLGRVYRFGYGLREIQQEPRRDLDLSSYNDFRVEAVSDPKETILTVHLPDHAVDGGYKFSVHFSKSQRLHDFTDADIVDRPSRNVVRYRWVRKPVAGPPVFSEYLRQTQGRFNVQFVTDLIMTEDSFTVPEFRNE